MESAQRGHPEKLCPSSPSKRTFLFMKTLGKKMAEFLLNPVNGYITWTLKKNPSFLSTPFLFSAQSPVFWFFPQELQKTDGHPILWICQWNHAKLTMFFWRDDIMFDNTEWHIPVCCSHRNLPDFITNELFKGISPDVFNLIQQILIQCLPCTDILLWAGHGTLQI